MIATFTIFKLWRMLQAFCGAPHALPEPGITSIRFKNCPPSPQGCSLWGAGYLYMNWGVTSPQFDYHCSRRISYFRQGIGLDYPNPRPSNSGII